MLRRISSIVVSALIAVGILAYMLYQVRETLPEAIMQMVPLYLVPAVIIAGLTWFLRGRRYTYILEGLSIRISTLHATAIVLLSQTANLVVPARLGDLVRMFILKDEGRATYSEGLSSIVVERVFDVVIIALLGLISLNFVINAPGLFLYFIAIPLVGGAIFVFILYGIGMIRSDNRYVKMILTMLHEVRKASLSARAVGLLSLSSLLIWLMDIAVCAVVVLMFQQTVGLPLVILAVAIGNLVKAIPLTPGGVGTYEAALATIFGLTGMPYNTAVLIAIIDHLIKNVVTLAGGLVSNHFTGGAAMRAMRKAFRVRVSGEESVGD